VSDRATKKPVDKALPVALQQAAYEDGVMVRVSGNNILLSPPLIVTSQDCQKIISALETGLKAVSA
jgi:adenosylmethionine-8-amino-7-oxononanoate aminotransferase